MLLWLTLACVSSSDMDSEATTAPDAVAELALGELLARGCDNTGHPLELAKQLQMTLTNNTGAAAPLAPEQSWEEAIAPAGGDDETWWMLELVGAAPSAPAGWNADLSPGESLIIQATAWILCIPVLDEGKPTGKYTVPEVGVYDTWPTWGPISLWVEVTITE